MSGYAVDVDQWLLGLARSTEGSDIARLAAYIKRTPAGHEVQLLTHHPVNALAQQGNADTVSHICAAPVYVTDGNRVLQVLQWHVMVIVVQCSYCRNKVITALDVLHVHAG